MKQTRNSNMIFRGGYLYYIQFTRCRLINILIHITCKYAKMEQTRNSTMIFWGGYPYIQFTMIMYVTTYWSLFFLLNIMHIYFTCNFSPTDRKHCNTTWWGKLWNKISQFLNLPIAISNIITVVILYLHNSVIVTSPSPIF